MSGWRRDQCLPGLNFASAGRFDPKDQIGSGPGQIRRFRRCRIWPGLNQISSGRRFSRRRPNPNSLSAGQFGRYRPNWPGRAKFGTSAGAEFGRISPSVRLGRIDYSSADFARRASAGSASEARASERAKERRAAARLSPTRAIVSASPTAGKIGKNKNQSADLARRSIAGSERSERRRTRSQISRDVECRARNLCRSTRGRAQRRVCEGVRSMTEPNARRARPITSARTAGKKLVSNKPN